MNFIPLILVVCFAASQETLQNTTKIENSNVSVSTTTTFVTTFVATSMETDDANVTTETALTTTCESNSSCLVSTVKPSTNNTSTEANSTKVVKKIQHLIDQDSNNEPCTCNLQVTTSFFYCLHNVQWAHSVTLNL